MREVIWMKKGGDEHGALIERSMRQNLLEEIVQVTFGSTGIIHAN